MFGLTWRSIKEDAMKLSYPFEALELNLTQEEQIKLKELVKSQTDAGGVAEKTEYESKKVIRGIEWKKLKHLVMDVQSDGQTIKIPLGEHEQLYLMRYIEAEKKEPNFIENGLAKKFMLETFLYVYYAGHGCMDHRQ